MAILFDGRFEEGATFNLYNRVDRETARSVALPPVAAGEPGSYEYVRDPLDLYGTVAKITVDNESPGRCELRPYEVSPAGPAVGSVFGEQWCWFSFMVPKTWIIDHPRGADVDANYLVPHGRELILQYHESPDVGDASHYPSLQMYIYGDKIAFALTYDTAASTTLRAPNIKLLGTWPLDQGLWQEWVIRLKVAYNTDGILEIYKNGRLEFLETGVPTFYNDTVGGYFKGGLYRYFDSQAPEKREILHRGFVLGDANSSYAEVSGQTLKNRKFTNSLA